MTHLCLENSVLFQGIDFSRHEDLTALLTDPTLAPLLLYPGEDSVELGGLGEDRRGTLLPPGKRPLVVVLDGTWRTVKKILAASPNLRALPSFRIAPSHPSEWIIRRQPRPECLATIEAVHAVIELLAPPDPERSHDNLLEVFQYMIGRQLEHRRRARAEALAPCVPVPPMWGQEFVVH